MIIIWYVMAIVFVTVSGKSGDVVALINENLNTHMTPSFTLFITLIIIILLSK